jgi:3-dehydroquinate synthetase
VLHHVREHVADAGHELTVLAGLAGMVKEAEIARALGILSQANVGRLLRCIQMYGLPVCTYKSYRASTQVPEAWFAVNQMWTESSIQSNPIGRRRPRSLRTSMLIR